MRTRYRQLCLVGWETTLRGEEHSVPYIVTTVGGGVPELTRMAPVKVERPPSVSPAGAEARTVAAGSARRVKIAIMTVLILVFNGATAWMLFKPAPTLTPS
ncbi:MAG: hypothetical protein HYV75_07445, partial [Opitutae bacterium]|nr:hypothetical protein [Opitutae bacterium]